jgi:hypothetical protein
MIATMRKLQLTEKEMRELERTADAPGTPPHVATRCRIILLKSQRLRSDMAVAAEVGASLRICRVWRLRYQQDGAEGLWHNFRPKAPKPPKRTGAVARFGVPHPALPRPTPVPVVAGPERLDVAGAYLSPQGHVVVASVDTRDMIQAPDLTRPAPPFRGHFRETINRGYLRHSLATLSAALNQATGALQGPAASASAPAPSGTGFLQFLQHLDEVWRKTHLGSTAKLHLIGCGFRVHNSVRQWLADHPRIILHLHPARAGWPGVAERWFRERAERPVRRGSLLGVPDLATAVERLTADPERKPGPFVWTIGARDIKARLTRGRRRLEEIRANAPGGI